MLKAVMERREADGSAPDMEFELYRYTPSLAAAIVSVVLFTILTGLHVWRMVRARAFYFVAFTIGGACKSILCTLNAHSSAPTDIALYSSNTRILRSNLEPL